MPIGNVDRSPADPGSSQTRIDPTAWCVRVALLLLVSPALLLVLIVGGLLMLAQAATRGLGKLSGLLRRDRPPGPSGLDGPEGSPAARRMAPGIEARPVRRRRGRPA